MAGIIWLASYPKSGNTWVRAFLHNLFINTDKPARLDELAQFVRLDPDSLAYESLARRRVKDMSLEEIAALRPKVHQALTRISSDSMFVKTHNFLGEAGGVPLITMECTVGAVYVVRNPLDVVLSMTRHYGKAIDEMIDALNDPKFRTASPEHPIAAVHNSWSTHVRSWTQNPSTALHVLRYEDMAEKPIKTFAALAKFLSLKPPRERLKKAIRFSSFNVLSKQEEAQGFGERSPFSERFFAVGRAGQWRKSLTPAQVDKIVTAHHEQMERFGYLPSASPRRGLRSASDERHQL
jgi:hypothetical protein